MRHDVLLIWPLLVYLGCLGLFLVLSSGRCLFGSPPSLPFLVFPCFPAPRAGSLAGASPPPGAQLWLWWGWWGPAVWCRRGCRRLGLAWTPLGDLPKSGDLFAGKPELTFEGSPGFEPPKHCFEDLGFLQPSTSQRANDNWPHGSRGMAIAFGFSAGALPRH